MPTDTLTLLDYAIVVFVPALAGYFVSSVLSRFAWFEALPVSKHSVVVAISVVLGTLLMLVKELLIQNPSALSSIDYFVKLILSVANLYIGTQIAYGRSASRLE